MLTIDTVRRKILVPLIIRNWWKFVLEINPNKFIVYIGLCHSFTVL